MLNAFGKTSRKPTQNFGYFFDQQNIVHFPQNGMKLGWECDLNATNQDQNEENA